MKYQHAPFACADQAFACFLTLISQSERDAELAVQPVFFPPINVFTRSESKNEVYEVQVYETSCLTSDFIFFFSEFLVK